MKKKTCNYIKIGDKYIFKCKKDYVPHEDFPIKCFGCNSCYYNVYIDYCSQ